MNCENRFLVDDPYSELDNHSPDDILVFNVDCEEEATDTNQIEVTGPEPEKIDYEQPHMQSLKEFFPLLPWEL